MRAYSELKLKLSNEAKSLKLSLSEHCENILINHANLLEKVKVLGYKVEELKQKNAFLKTSFSQVDVSNFNKKIQQVTNENSLLKNKLMELKSNQQIYSDPRLYDIFNEVKGESAKIITDKGQINITFNTPKDVLLALIYSYKI